MKAGDAVLYLTKGGKALPCRVLKPSRRPDYRTLICDRQANLYEVFPDACIASDQRLRSGVVPFTPVMAKQFKRETDELLHSAYLKQKVQSFGIRGAARRVIRRGRLLPYEKSAVLPSEGRGLAAPWDIPLKLADGMTGGPGHALTFYLDIGAEQGRREARKLDLLRRYNPHHYEALVASRYAGIRLADIARMTGRAQSTVRSDKRRALLFMRRVVLEDDYR